MGVVVSSLADEVKLADVSLHAVFFSLGVTATDDTFWNFLGLSNTRNVLSLLCQIFNKAHPGAPAGEECGAPSQPSEKPLPGSPGCFVSAPVKDPITVVLESRG